MTRALRFQPDPLDYALIDFSEGGLSFNPQAVALIANESYAGCALIFKFTEAAKSEGKIKVKVGRLAIMEAEVVWLKALDGSLLQMGVKFLE